MSNDLAVGAGLLRARLAGSAREIEVTLRLPRPSAEKVLALLDAEQSGGATVVRTRPEYTTTEAATILDMSRPTLMKLIHAGRIQHRMVGHHHRIPASAIRTYQDRQSQADEAATTPLGELANRVGQLE